MASQTQNNKTTMENFKEELEHLINKHSMKNGSNTPDFILANYMTECLAAFNKAAEAVHTWCTNKEVIPKQSEQELTIKRTWYQDGELFIHTNCRSGLFHAPIDYGKKFAYFLVDIRETDALPSNETIYRLMDIITAEEHAKKQEDRKNNVVKNEPLDPPIN